jgi:signal transduction histidine kinase/ActR/RegA family two-component response regulator
MVMGWGPDLLSFFNNSYRLMIGSRFNSVPGRPAAEQWSGAWPGIEPIARQALAGQGSYYENMPFTLDRNGEKENTCWTLSLQPFRDARGHVAGVYCLLVETTEKLQAEQRKAEAQRQQAFLLKVSDVLRDVVEPESMMQQAAEQLGRHLGAASVGYGQVDETGEWIDVAQVWSRDGLAVLAGRHRLQDYGAAVAAELRSGRTVAVNDTGADPLTGDAACRQRYQQLQARAFVNSPLITQGRVAMVLFVINSRPRVWLDTEQALVQEVAERTWAARQRLLAEKNLRQTHAVLEQRTSELLRSEMALRQSQKLEALGQLTGGVAHDFNNLLAVINTSVELLCSHRLPAEHSDYYLDLIRDTVARAVKLTGQLLAFARQQPLMPEVFDVDQQVKGVIDLIRPLMGSQVKIFHHPCNQDSCFALADISQFETALVNLAVNARDAMNAQGSFNLRVQKVGHIPAGIGRDVQPGDFIAITASDTGCGIAPEKLEAIFEPFYTTKEVGRGTGLGLSQVFGFAKQSGGEVDVSSEPGKGTVFTLYMPCADKAARPQQDPSDAEQPAISWQGLGILVVEDNEALARITCKILDVLGFRAVRAASAAAALSLLAQDATRFSLVFSDVVMPGMNGIELGEQLRREYPGLPVVLTSGYHSVMAEKAKHGFELVLKPYTSETLAQVFSQTIARRRPEPPAPLQPLPGNAEEN